MTTTPRTFARSTSLAALGALAASVALAFVAAAQEPAPQPPAAPPAAEVPAAPAPAPSAAPAPPAAPSAGEPLISLDLEQASVRAALEAITEQTGWSLVIASPGGAEQGELTLRLRNLPASEAVDVVLAASDLEAKRVGGALVVTAKAGGPAPQTLSVPTSLGTFTVNLDESSDSPDDDEDGEDFDPDDNVRIGGNTEVDAGTAVGDAVQIGGPVVVRGHVLGDAVAIGGWVTLEPTAVVDGDVVAVGGSLIVRPGARIAGDAVAIGGMVDAADDAQIGGDRVSLGGRIGAIILAIVTGISEGAPFLWRVSIGLVRAAVLLSILWLLVSFVPERVARVRGFMVERTALSALGGIGLFVGLLPLCALLTISVIGIPLVMVVFVAFAAVVVLGLAAVAIWIGERLPIAAGRKGPVGALLVGFAVLFVIRLVPILGTFVLLLVSMLAAGAALLSRLGRVPPPPPAPELAPVAVAAEPPATEPPA